MQRLLTAFALTLGVSLPLAALADTPIKLFKDYAYGQPRSQFAKQKGVYDCTEDVGSDALCLDDVRFLDHDFGLSLLFSEGKLYRVALTAEYDSTLFSQLLGGLSQTFTLVALNDGRQQLDVLQLARTDANATVTLSNFEGAALNAGDLTYSMLENNPDPAGQPNLPAALKHAPHSIRSADVVVTGDDDGDLLVVRFTLPNMETRQVIDAAQKPVESF